MLVAPARVRISVWGRRSVSAHIDAWLDSFTSVNSESGVLSRPPLLGRINAPVSIHHRICFGTFQMIYASFFDTKENHV